MPEPENSKIVTLKPLISQYYNIIPRNENYTGNLYHYTTANGLLGIIESNGIWCSNVYYMNDKSELKISKYIIEKSIEDSKKWTNNNSFYTFIKNTFDTILKSGMTIYTASFSENGDLLSQWRGYSDMGNGYSIGMTPLDIANLKYDDNVYVFIRKVVYDPKIQFSIMGEIMSIIYSEYLKLFPNETDLSNDKLVNEFKRDISYILIDVMTWFKHYTFEEEKEWRIGVILLTDRCKMLKFRSGYRKIIPYLSVKAEPNNPDDKLKIKEMISGPLLDPDLTSLSIYLLLERNKYWDVNVKHSNIPLCT